LIQISENFFVLSTMVILVIGNQPGLVECRQKFGEDHQYQFAESHADAREFINSETVVFDFMVDGRDLQIYQDFSGVVFLDVSRHTWTDMAGSRATFFGFCGLATFLNREILEVSLLENTDLDKLENVCRKLNTKFAVVKDQVGLVYCSRYA